MLNGLILGPLRKFLRLKSAKINPRISKKALDIRTEQLLASFPHSPALELKARELQLAPKLISQATAQFLKSIRKDSVLKSTVSRSILVGSPDALAPIYPRFFQFLREKYRDKLGAKFLTLAALSDLSNPTLWYPLARTQKRRIIMHVGPTNSGKTHAALERFANCKSGVYCGPLRLLAHEIYERMNLKGVPCNLLTGEERKESSNVTKWSSTIEMAQLDRHFDVAVLDEIQMISDTQRGWAWTQALLGIQADEIHLCGEATAVLLVEKICKETGDSLEILKYNRLTSLTIEKASLKNNLKNIQAGDAIIVFSRQGIFDVKARLESVTSLRAAVIYGSLPPETRSEQARLFNDPKSDRHVLIASNAIGMGLNLNIKRIVFQKTTKFDGEQDSKLSISELKQIAGRAGRFGTQWDNGSVTAISDQAFQNVRETMKLDAPPLTMAGVHPTLEQIEKFSAILDTKSLPAILLKYQELTNSKREYFLCNLDQQYDAALCIADIPMSLGDRYVFVNGPANMNIPLVKAAFYSFAHTYSNGQQVPISQYAKIPPVIKTKEQLKEAEITHRVISLYLWLALRYPVYFDQLENARDLKMQCCAIVNGALLNMQGASPIVNQTVDVFAPVLGSKSRDDLEY